MVEKDRLLHIDSPKPLSRQENPFSFRPFTCIIIEGYMQNNGIWPIKSMLNRTKELVELVTNYRLRFPNNPLKQS